MSFRSCVNRTACTEDGTHCRACGRSHEEIAQLRQLVNDTYALVNRWEYDNLDEFFSYLQKKIGKKLKHSA
ncbi:MAG: DUF1289 domain-containing protein [Gammaproteobacteria bacterium]|nr:DUF1289 domain-containing protein [Gammaproteobacteria bacterium]